MLYSASPTILKETDLGQIAWDAIEPIWDDLPLSPFYKVTNFLATLSEGQRGLISLDWCQKEVRNGGFTELFGSSTGNLVPAAIEGCTLIGALKYEQIFRAAMSLLGDEFPVSAAARKRAMVSWNGQQKSELDEYEANLIALINSDDEDLEKYRGRFVLEHSDHFINDE